MQFVTDGPDIPEALLQAHEEGRVVFFCGAGISYPAGLPGFEGLVKQLYDHVGDTQDADEAKFLEDKQFDRTIGHFENRVRGGRKSVRHHLAKILTPDLNRRAALTSHLALLTLGQQRPDGTLRIVTTNFDTLFEVAQQRTRQKTRIPEFPVHPEPPARSRWEGLVYLHGRMPSPPSDADLDRLILSDADFGKAYLQEAWAARFVANLFREFTVCFVGYSIDDPVLRYMTAAHAADANSRKMFAFAAFAGEVEREKQKKAWQAKSVSPILYDDANRHRNLHRSLQIWAAIYRDGTRGLERIVGRLAGRDPRKSPPKRDFVGRMLWALSDKTGLPAKRFAEMNPVPSLEWLHAFSEERFEHGDLLRFGVRPDPSVDSKLRFSLIRRPAPYHRAPPIQLVIGQNSPADWDNVMYRLGRWLVRHLGDPTLILWIAAQGGKLHERWSWLITGEIDRLVDLEREGNTAELEKILADAPNAIPGKQLRVLWRLLLSGLVKAPGHEGEIEAWEKHLERDGLSASLRFELRELLAPKVTLQKQFLWGPEDPKDLRHSVEWELVLATNHLRETLEPRSDGRWGIAHHGLIGDFQLLLMDALDLLQELGDADARRDPPFWYLPSIAHHPQNRGSQDWILLIELLRDAWLAAHSSDPARATLLAQGWFEFPYRTFKRLAFFAASQDNCIKPGQWVNWLLTDACWWLWAIEPRREVCRLLVLQGRNLAQQEQTKLEAAILAGPPREMCRDDLEPNEWERTRDHSVWFLLAKLKISNIVMGEVAAARLEELTGAYPMWQLEANESDEFPIWFCGTDEPNGWAHRVIDEAPRNRRQLVQWLRRPPADRSQHPMYEKDNWPKVCRERPLHCLWALRELATNGEWPIERWRGALQAWSADGIARRSWHYAAPLVLELVERMSEEELLRNANILAEWLNSAAPSIVLHENTFFSLCQQILNLPLAATTRITLNGQPADPVTSAINHPVGQVAEALLKLWFTRKPNDAEGLPADIEPQLTALCDLNVDRFRHGRVMLASRLIALFRVDRFWAEKYLLPLFSWSACHAEALAMWSSFLCSPKIYQPLLLALKTEFLETARHYQDLGDRAQQFAKFLTYVAMNLPDGFQWDDFRQPFSELPQKGLEISSRILARALDSAADEREEYWKNRIRPFWHHVWPKSNDLATPAIAESLGRLSLAAGAEFPAALKLVLPWLSPLEHDYVFTHRLADSGQCRQHPTDSLQMLAEIVDERTSYVPRLRECLDSIVEADPDLAQDRDYLRLREFCRMRGG